LATAHATNLEGPDLSPPKENIKPPSSSTGVPLVDAYKMFDVEPQDTLEDEDAEEEKKIKAATSLITSACGTYVVRSKEGLTIFPTRPEISKEGEENTELRDVDTLMKKKSTTEALLPVELSNGDRVQIVTIDEDGWAKLPRGYGFVQTRGNNFVKVAGSVDKACKLEAMLHSLSLARRNLRKQQKYVDNQFVLLMNELQASLINDEDLTVIAGEVFQTPIINADIPDHTLQEASLIDVSCHDNVRRDSGSMCRDSAASLTEQQNEKKSTPMKNHNNNKKGNDDAPYNDVDLSKPVTLTRQETPQNLLHEIGLICSLGGGGILSSVDPDHEAENVANISSKLMQERDQSSSREARSLQQRQQEQASAAMSAGAQAWRESRGRQEVTGLDFRAMSGHFGLLSTHAHAHEYLAPEDSGMRTMSSHSGLSRQSRPRSNAHENTSLQYEPRMMSCHSGLSMSRSAHTSSFNRSRSSQTVTTQSDKARPVVEKSPSFPSSSNSIL